MAWRAFLPIAVLGCAACSSNSHVTFDPLRSSGGSAGDESIAGETNGGSMSETEKGGSGGGVAQSGGGGGSSSQAGATAGGAGAGATTSGGSSSGGTSNHDQPDCKSDFEGLDKACKTAGDCELVEHQIDCCGTILIMGLAATAVPGFSSTEQYCAAQFPPCGCAARGMQLEDGSLIDFGSSAYAAECVDHRCRSHSTAATSPCGPLLACTVTQYCSEFSGGASDSEPSYACQPLGDCRACSCLNIGAGCHCSEQNGAIKVGCFAP